MEKRPVPAETLHHQGIAVEDVLADQLRVLHRREELPIGTDQLKQAQVVGQVEVVHAMVWGRVHQARAGVGSDIIRQQDRALPIDPGVAGNQSLELLATPDLNRMQRFA